jgi:nucleoside 2-deoxyribosyltransferase
MTTIYFAGPLFSAAEIRFNLSLSDILHQNGYQVFLPQRECEGKELADIYETCKSGIDQANVVVAIMDGADADSGTCWECGYAYAKGVPVIIVRTDFRKSGDTRGFNAMLYYSAAAIVESTNDYATELINVLKTTLAK